MFNANTNFLITKKRRKAGRKRDLIFSTMLGALRKIRIPEVPNQEESTNNQQHLDSGVVHRQKPNHRFDAVNQPEPSRRVDPCSHLFLIIVTRLVPKVGNRQWFRRSLPMMSHSLSRSSSIEKYLTAQPTIKGIF